MTLVRRTILLLCVPSDRVQLWWARNLVRRRTPLRRRSGSAQSVALKLPGNRVRGKDGSTVCLFIIEITVRE